MTNMSAYDTMTMEMEIMMVDEGGKDVHTDNFGLQDDGNAQLRYRWGAEVHQRVARS